jgi:toxin ParE1/3/4
MSSLEHGRQKPMPPNWNTPYQLLADNPRMGREAEAIAPGIRRHEHGSHVILYEISSDGVVILALVHASSVKRLTL